MRTGLILSVVLLVTLTAGGVIAEKVTGSIADRYMEASYELLALAQMQDYNRLLTVCESYEEDWKDTMDWLTMLINHDDADAVTAALLDVKAGALARNVMLCEQAALRLQEEAQHLHHRDCFTIGNIL